MLTDDGGLTTSPTDKKYKWGNSGADPGFLDRGFKSAGGGGSICAVWPIFPEIPHENEIV